MEKKYLIYDSRYRTNPDKAICFDVCDTLKEAEKNIAEYGDNNVVVEYEVNGKEIINPKIVN